MSKKEDKRMTVKLISLISALSSVESQAPLYISITTVKLLIKELEQLIGSSSERASRQIELSKSGNYLDSRLFTSL